MDFSLRRSGAGKIKFYESNDGSRIQLVFVPGPFNPELWRQQFRYFSKNYTAISFDTWRRGRDFESMARALETVLEQDEVHNAVLVAYGPGNPLVQQVEHHESVAATVMTGVYDQYPALPRKLFNATWSFARREPKIAKKLFFSDNTSYRVVSGFTGELEPPVYQEFISYARALRKPVKKSLIIHPVDDRFASRQLARSLKPGASLALIKSAGCFSFYEKPQEYNKALHDFLENLEDFVEDREIQRTRRHNRSLGDFTPRISK